MTPKSPVRRPSSGHAAMSLLIATMVNVGTGCGDKGSCPDVGAVACDEFGLPSEYGAAYCDECEVLWVCQETEKTIDGDWLYGMQRSTYPCQCVDADGYLSYFDESIDSGEPWDYECMITD